MEYLLHHAAQPDRVRANTWPEVNERIDRDTGQRIAQYEAGPEQELSRRLQDLSREWDFERVVEAEASAMALTGLSLGLAVDRRFLLIPGFVAAMVLLHAVQGWYPLLPLFRRLGFRSQDEIDRERYALKALRGDFADVAAAGSESSRRATAAWKAVCA